MPSDSYSFAFLCMDEAGAGFSGVWRGLSGRDGVTPAKHWGVCGR